MKRSHRITRLIMTQMTQMSVTQMSACLGIGNLWAFSTLNKGYMYVVGHSKGRTR